MNIKYQIKKLVVNECACYSPSMNRYTNKSVIIKDYCDKEKEDCRCFIFKDKRCGYFEKAVLPINPQLEALYKAEKLGYELPKEEKEKISTVKGKVNIHCKRCGKTFLADNYRRKYCDSCKRYIWREKNREKDKLN